MALRARAQKMGLTLNEYALARIDTKEPVASETEEEIYKALGLAWIPPELRENQGEIEAAEAGKLPKLVELGDIRGDLHMHTRESDGRATLEEMAEAARALGTNMSRSRIIRRRWRWPTGWTKSARSRSRTGCGRWIRAGSGCGCFPGSNATFAATASMDLEDDALGELDLVIGSVHSYMNLESAEMTDRLLRALECPHLRVLGHPTGRSAAASRPVPVRF